MDSCCTCCRDLDGVGSTRQGGWTRGPDHGIYAFCRTCWDALRPEPTGAPEGAVRVNDRCPVCRQPVGCPERPVVGWVPAPREGGGVGFCGECTDPVRRKQALEPYE